jgi:cardiolipin synthase
MEQNFKVAFCAVLLILAAYFLPEYHATTSESRETAAKTAEQAARIEMAAVPPYAALTLLTEPGDGIGAMHDAIARASKSLDLVIYELGDASIEQDLADAQARGVRVRVILENVVSFKKHPNQAAFDFLKAHGVPVEWANKNFALTHQKTLIIDAGAGGARALIMTFNLAPQYYASSRDFALADSDPVDVAAIEAAFNGDWNGSIATAAVGGAANGSDLVWSPGSAATLLALIDSAQGASSTLDVYNEEMADARITAALEQAAARGVRVRVVMSYATAWKSALNELAAAGVGVRTFASNAKFYIHAKAIIADDGTGNARAFVGSENFSVPSLDLNRELGILIVRPDIITSLERTFNRDWITARPYSIR